MIGYNIYGTTFLCLVVFKLPYFIYGIFLIYSFSFTFISSFLRDCRVFLSWTGGDCVGMLLNESERI